MQPKRIHLIAAARPNFMKVAPLYHALAQEKWCTPHIVHTGQHYDANMSDAFFRDLRLPRAAHHLEVGSGTHAEQTGRTMMAYEAVCLRDRPDAIVVVGDVNATVACAMVGTKLWIPVIHLEAGLRSRDRRMPEEINRLATDAIADLLWTPSPDADENLRAEGVPAQKIVCIGNIMIDSFEMLRGKIESADDAPSAGPRWPTLRRGHASPPLERGRARQTRRARHDPGGALSRAGGRVRHPSAHPQAAGGFRPAGHHRGRPGNPVHRTLELYRIHESRHRVHAGDHRLGGRAGGDHLPRHPLRDPAGEHRTPDHDHRGDEPPSEARRAGGCGERSAGGEMAGRTETGAMGRSCGRSRGERA